jgi:hypothetical protein
VLERALEVVDDRQPLPGHLGPGVGPGPLHLGGTPLTQIVQVSEGTQLLVLGLGEPGLQVSHRGDTVRGVCAVGHVTHWG